MGLPATFLLLFLLFSTAEASAFGGKVVSVLDGDTIDVMHDGKAQRVRLKGIDCPEKRQAFGQRAKQATSALVFAKSVTVETHGRDKYKRALGDVFLSDGTHINRELVAQGWCWHYEKYAPNDVILAGLEVTARVTKKGLWADPDPIPPWEWRKRGKAVH